MSEPALALQDYLPHRPPMLLLSRMVSVTSDSACAEIDITNTSSFYMPNQGVPAWIGLEYMGQTAALIAGYQKLHNNLAEHTGFLLGTRRFHTNKSWFALGTCLRVECRQAASVGENLATFDCTIKESNLDIATARLSVFRQAVN